MKRFAGSAAVAPVIVATAVFGTAALSVTAGSPFEDMSKATTVSPGTTTTARVTAKTASWRVVAKVGPYGSQVSGTLTASTQRAAWSVWTGQGFTAVDRWNGSAWRQVAVPAKLTGAVRSAVAFDGNTPGNFWLFDAAHPVTALRYSGTKWAAQRIPAWALRRQSGGGGYDVVTNVWGSYSDSHVWVFSLNAGAYAAYYNGHAWHKEPLPATPLAVDVDASNDAWALGAREIMHWNPFAGGWHTMPLPPLPPGGGILPEGSIQYTELTASGPDDVWLVGQVTATAGPAKDVWFTEQWNGKRWGFNVGPHNFAGSVAPDGHGGLWADSIDANPGGFWFLGHLSGGRWTGVRLPPGVWSQSPLTMTWIPGSRSLWATARSIGTRGTKALILKYGS